MISTVLLIIFVLKLYLDNVTMQIRVSFAEEQTMIFETMADQARNAPVQDKVGYLEYVVQYYPSGTKQTQGSELDLTVERFRRCVVREIIADLRRKTNQDFGDNPEEWVRNLKKQD
jgi:hypothetical protein